MNAKGKLLKFKRKTITKDELKKVLQISGDEELHELIAPLLQDAFLVPMANSLPSGSRSMPLFEKYRICIAKENDEKEARAIALLHPILADGLKNDVQKYKQYKMHFEALNKWLFNYDKLKRSPDIAFQLDMMSRKERSFEIFGEEKLLDDKTFNALLLRMGLDEKALMYYDTPACSYLDYIPRKKDGMRLLVLENKDIWFNLRRIFYEGMTGDKKETQLYLFDVAIDGILYGCGNQITKARGLTEYTKFLGVKAQYYYWGDIDRAGLNIYSGVVNSNKELDIRLFKGAYEKMLALSEQRQMPFSSDMREQMVDYNDIYATIDEAYRQAMVACIEKNRRIPQEIINYPLLKSLVRIEENL